MFKIDESRIWELVQIEEEVNCDIGAGDIGNPKVNDMSYVDSNKLIALLQDELSAVLHIEEIEAIASLTSRYAAELQEQVRHRINQQKSV
jgi:hypothetical protein